MFKQTTSLAYKESSTFYIKSNYLVIITIVISFLSNLGCNSHHKYIKANTQTYIETTIIDNKVVFGGLRGAIFYKKNHFISSSAKLIGNNPIDKKMWDTHGPIIDFNDKPHQYTLADLSYPYEVSKKENCDTILVIKDFKELMFLMYNK